MMRRRGIILPSFEIYGGVSGLIDYGPVGARIKRRIVESWVDHWTSHGDIVEIDSPSITPKEVLVASGHVGEFNDYMSECASCEAIFRSDHLIEDLHPNPDSISGDEIDKIISENNVACPNCGEFRWSPARPMNLMFPTTIGAMRGGREAFMRPETAQGMFINFANVLNTSRKKPPFGIAQIGKAFRNEITPGNFVFRTREFEQMEMEFFVSPEESAQWYEYWCEERMNWYADLGMPRDTIRLRPHDDDELSHYSSGTSDVEYLFPWGWDELEGIANRGDFDLNQHAEHSGEKLDFFDQASGERYVPHVIEPAAGATRTAMAFLMAAYDEEVVNDDTRTVLRLDHRLAPYKVAVLPLSKKDTLTPTAHEVFDALKGRWMADYDETQAIGKRYRRQDEIGTPYCVTVDFDTLEDRAVTVRERDSMEQDRVSLDQLETYLADRLT